MERRHYFSREADERTEADGERTVQDLLPLEEPCEVGVPSQRRSNSVSDA